MTMKIVLLLVTFLILILVAPSLMMKEVNSPSVQDGTRNNKPRKSYQRWKGPKTDERINQMLKESIVLMKELGVPISESICPAVTLTGAHTYIGCCCPKGSRKKYNEYDYNIEISGFALKNTEKTLRNILIHELIHTVPDGLRHTGEWKKWAKYVSDNTEYKIQRYADENAIIE